MSFAKTHSGQSYYLKGKIIDIEVDLSRGLHSFSIVGLPDKAIEEAKDRISAAIKNSGYVSPKQKNQRVIISLAPADIKKEGSHFDLAMAVGYLRASGDIRFESKQKIFVGELSLDGSVRKVYGVLSVALEARAQGFTEIFIPVENSGEVQLINDIKIYPVSHLKEVIEILTKKSNHHNTKQTPTQKQTPEKIVQSDSEKTKEINLEDIVGQNFAKRGLEISAAGGHNILMSGPPGTGKTMLAQTLKNLLPKLSKEEILEVTSIHSSLGLTTELIFNPPFRSPHHTSSHTALVGGGNTPRPGEVTLAHRGILFLDEFPEFDRGVIETLRQPIEEHTVNITRAKSSINFPANFLFVAAMNPCPCGFRTSRKKVCLCSIGEIARYKKKISGPILDRIDLLIEVGDVEFADIQKNPLRPQTQPTQNNKATNETLETIKRISVAREKQWQRFGTKTKLNSGMSGGDLALKSNLTPQATKILLDGAESFGLSMRSYHRVWRVARTIADLDDSDQTEEKHVLEAFQFRKTD
jgi:magnesium chelatase family protein